MPLTFSQDSLELDHLRDKKKSLAQKELQIEDSLKKIDEVCAVLESKRHALREELDDTREKKRDVECELVATQRFVLDAVLRTNLLMEQLEPGSLLAPSNKEPQAEKISTQPSEPASSHASKKASSPHDLPCFSSHADLDAMVSVHSPISDTSSDFPLADEPLDAKREPLADFANAEKYAGCMFYDFSRQRKYIGPSDVAQVQHEPGREKDWSTVEAKRLKQIDWEQLRAYCTKAYETYEEGDFDCPLCFAMVAAGTRKDVFQHLIRHHAQKGRRYRLDCYPYRCPECRYHILLEIDEAKDHDMRKHGICWASIEDREEKWCVKNVRERLDELFEESFGWR